MPQPVPIVGKVMYEHMKSKGIKTIGYIGYSDRYGDLWFNDLKTQAGADGHQPSRREERFARPDTSVTGQVLKLIAANPDADPGRRLRHRARRCRRPTLRERGLRGPDLSDPRRRLDGLHPHRRHGGRRRADGLRSGDVSGRRRPTRR